MTFLLRATLIFTFLLLVRTDEDYSEFFLQNAEKCGNPFADAMWIPVLDLCNTNCDTMKEICVENDDLVQQCNPLPDECIKALKKYRKKPRAATTVLPPAPVPHFMKAKSSATTAAPFIVHMPHFDTDHLPGVLTTKRKGSGRSIQVALSQDPVSDFLATNRLHKRQHRRHIPENFWMPRRKVLSGVISRRRTPLSPKLTTVKRRRRYPVRRSIGVRKYVSN